MKVLSKLQNSVKINGTSFILLIDPDKKNNDKIEKLVEHANINDVDAIFIGGSLMMDSLYHERIARIKSISNIPLILFPGGINQINRHFDAMLFMSLISTRKSKPSTNIFLSLFKIQPVKIVFSFLFSRSFCFLHSCSFLDT